MSSVCSSSVSVKKDFDIAAYVFKFRPGDLRKRRLQLSTFCLANKIEAETFRDLILGLFSIINKRHLIFINEDFVGTELSIDARDRLDERLMTMSLWANQRNISPSPAKALKFQEFFAEYSRDVVFRNFNLALNFNDRTPKITFAGQSLSSKINSRSAQLMISNDPIKKQKAHRCTVQVEEEDDNEELPGVITKKKMSLCSDGDDDPEYRGEADLTPKDIDRTKDYKQMTRHAEKEEQKAEEE